MNNFFRRVIAQRYDSEYAWEMRAIIIRLSGWVYRHILRRFFFLFDSEPIHNFFLGMGLSMSRIPGIPSSLAFLYSIKSKRIESTFAGMHFSNPIGLAAGFDNEAMLTGILLGLGFGFGSVGTVTNGSYPGNAYPRLKRLPKSRALLVNKGFKSSGVDAVLARLTKQHMSVPVGISLGRTNSALINSHDAAISDIVSAFTKVIHSKVPFSYFELNISCPNLKTKVEFYEPNELARLLQAVCALPIQKPLCIKMPIMLSNESTIALVDTIRKFPVAAIIIGNLQKDRSHPTLNKEEIAPFLHYPGNWSGMPCKDRSDELIALVYRHTSGTLPIIGCGGVFSADDAYRKITLGASAIQLATALVFEGPFIPAEITLGLIQILKTQRINSLEDVVGCAHKELLKK